MIYLPTNFRGSRVVGHVARMLGATCLSAMGPKTWGCMGEPTRSSPMVTLPDGNQVLLGVSHEGHWRTWRGGNVYMGELEVMRTGEGVGGRVLTAMLSYAVAHEAGIRIYKVTNPRFFRRFAWLRDVDGEFRWDPPVSWMQDAGSAPAGCSVRT